MPGIYLSFSTFGNDKSALGLCMYNLLKYSGLQTNDKSIFIDDSLHRSIILCYFAIGIKIIHAFLYSIITCHVISYF